MSNCNSIRKKLFLFDEASEDEQQEIRSHLSACKVCQRAADEQKAILAMLSRQHEDTELRQEDVVRYAIHTRAPEEADHDGKRLSRAERIRIEEAMAADPVAAARVSLLAREFESIEQYLEEEGLPDLELAPGRSKSALHRFTALLNLPAEALTFFARAVRPANLGLGLAAASVLFAFHFSLQSKNPYHDLAVVQKSEFTFVTRSSSTSALNTAINEFQNRRYEQVIAGLQQPVRQEQDRETQFSMRYLLGICHLLLAEKQLLWVRQDFDRQHVEQAIAELRMAQDLASVAGAREGSLWYLTKAHLMLADTTNAERTLREIVGMRGRYFRQAKELLNRL